MATQASIDLVQQLYIAYYGRPGDPGGIDYWAERFDLSDDLTDVLDAFGNSDEYVNNFGSLTTSQLINNLYQQLFNRSADDEGLAFYTDRLESGAATLASIAKQIVDGVVEGNDDFTTLDNKTTVANDFTDSVREDGADYNGTHISTVQAILASIDETSDSVTSGLVSVASAIADILEESVEESEGGGDLVLFPEDIDALFSLIGLNDETGVLSTATLRELVIAETGESDYNSAFDPSNYAGADDGTFTEAELGLSGLGDLPANQDTMESLWYGTLINAFQAIDIQEATELSDFVLANEEVFSSGDTSSIQQDYIDLLVGIFEDEAVTPIYSDELIQTVAVTGTVALVEVVAGSSVGIYDDFTGFFV
ncbi:MAG: DUF4214 domain-containing protein [Neptuniibacter sp.]